MVNAIVLYNSRGGNTKKVAEKIAEGLGVESFSIKQFPKIIDHELIVVGTWILAGGIRFAGARLLKKLSKKPIDGKKIALFLTCSAPDDINPFTENTPNPKTIKEVAFSSMEERLNKEMQVEIIPERFVAKGALRMSKNGTPKGPVGHPSDEELAQAIAFGTELKTKYFD
jgi:flavodoxin